MNRHIGEKQRKPDDHPERGALHLTSAVRTSPLGVATEGSATACPVKCRSVTDLEELRSKAVCREKAKSVSIAISVGTCATAKGAAQVAHAIRRELHERHLNDSVGLRRTGCRGLCEIEPVVVIYPWGLVYRSVTPADVPEIVSESVLKGRVVDRLLYLDPSTGQRYALESEIPFYQEQRRVILENHMSVDPQSIDDYIAAGGYSAMSRVLLEMGPEEVLEEIDRSGLCTRGYEGGLLISKKWASCRARTETNGVTCVVCNANEADPGAGVARSLLEGNPHSIIEGMIIGAFTVGSQFGHVYVRSSYSLAAENLAIALSQARRYGILGNDILSSGFDFDITFSCESGAFTCDESVESPTEASDDLQGDSQRLRSCHVLLHNVETWANVPIIVGQGSRWYSDIETGTRKGTKIFSLAGAINKTGLVEVPMGTTLREIVCGIGGGVRNGKALKAVHVGGPAGGFIPAKRIDMKIDFESLAEAGASMGSGSMVVMDEGTCMVDVTRYFVRFLADNHCGKCTGCQIGLGSIVDILDRIAGGHGKEADIILLERLGKVISEGSLCETGANAANAVLSSTRFFPQEYRAHVSEKRCPAGKCKSLITFNIDGERCSGCGECAEECPEGAITGRESHPHTIDGRLCVKCGICGEVCENGAIVLA